MLTACAPLSAAAWAGAGDPDRGDLGTDTARAADLLAGTAGGVGIVLAVAAPLLAVTGRAPGAVVVGHVVGIVAAHDRAVEVSPAGRAAVSQAPMVAVMIGYTGLALLLLFAQ